MIASDDATRFVHNFASIRSRIAGVDPAVAVFVIGAFAASGYLLYLGRHATFFNDEWVFIVQRSLFDLDDLLRPHNGHPSMTLVLVWRTLFEIVGLHTYLPYLAVLLMIHAVAGAGVFWLVRGLAGTGLAFASGAVFLLLGTAYENLFWSFQMGFVGSVAAGTWALGALHADRTRLAVPIVLLLISIGSSGIGLSFLAAAIVLVVFGLRPRKQAPAVLIPAMAYAAWYAIYARGTTDPGGLTVENLLKMPSWIQTGASRAVGGLTGLGDGIGSLLFLAVVSIVVVRLLREPLSGIASNRAWVTALAAGAMIGIVVQFGLVGLARGHLQAGNDLALAPRYMYAPAAFFLIAMAALTGPPPLEVGRARAWVRRSLVVLPFALLAFIANVHTLHISGVPYFEYQVKVLRTSLAIAGQFPNAPAILAGNWPVAVPPSEMRDLIVEHGSPTADVIYSRAPLEPDANAYDQILYSIVAPSFRVRELDDLPNERLPATVLGTDALAATVRDGCTSLTGSGAVESQVSFVAESASTHALIAEQPEEIQVYLSSRGVAQEANSVRASLRAGAPLQIEVPDMGTSFEWTILVKFTSGLAVCRALQQSMSAEVPRKLLDPVKS